MKKLLSLLLALAMLLGCTAFAEGVDYTGNWVLTGAEEQGMTMGPSALATIGMDITMTLNADGTAVLTAMGEAEDGVWSANETGVAITDASNMTMNAVYQDEMFIIEQNGSKMMFTREGAEPAVQEAAAPTVLANVDPKAFEGQWLLTKSSMMGMEFSADQLGLYMAFVLSEGVGIYAETDENGELLQLDVTYTVTEVEGAGTVLELIYSGELVAEPVVLLSLNMLEDGTLYMGADMEGLTVAYYFAQPVAEEAAAETATEEAPAE